MMCGCGIKWTNRTNKHKWRCKLVQSIITGSIPNKGSKDMEYCIQSILLADPSKLFLKGLRLGPNDVVDLTMPSVIFEPGKGMLKQPERPRKPRKPIWRTWPNLKPPSE